MVAPGGKIGVGGRVMATIDDEMLKRALCFVREAEGVLIDVDNDGSIPNQLGCRVVAAGIGLFLCRKILQGEVSGEDAIQAILSLYEGPAREDQRDRHPGEPPCASFSEAANAMDRSFKALQAVVLDLQTAAQGGVRCGAGTKPSPPAHDVAVIREAATKLGSMLEEYYRPPARAGALTRIKAAISKVRGKSP